MMGAVQVIAIGARFGEVITFALIGRLGAMTRIRPRTCFRHEPLLSDLFVVYKLRYQISHSAENAF